MSLETIQNDIGVNSSSASALEQNNSKLFYEDDSDKITKNLSSLRFDASINDPERQLLFLRKRSQVLTINIVSHAVFTSNILWGLKRKLFNGDVIKESRLKIGVMGCGRIGTHLVQALLEYTRILPEDITICTRRPEEVMIDCQGKGITCTKDNSDIAKEVDILFLCFPPQQFTKVSNELKRSGIASHCLVYSVIAGITAKKISDMIEHSLVMKPTYTYQEEEYMDENQWNYSTGIVPALAMNEFKELTCPLYLTENKIVKIDETLLHCLFLQMLNLCMLYNKRSTKMEEFVTLCNHILFRGMVGFSFDSIEQMGILLEEDHRFKISEFLLEHKVGMRLDDSTQFAKNFEKHYKIILDRFVDWTVF